MKHIQTFESFIDENSLYEGANNKYVVGGAVFADVRTANTYLNDYLKNTIQMLSGDTNFYNQPRITMTVQTISESELLETARTNYVWGVEIDKKDSDVLLKKLNSVARKIGAEFTLISEESNYTGTGVGDIQLFHKEYSVHIGKFRNYGDDLPVGKYFSAQTAAEAKAFLEKNCIAVTNQKDGFGSVYITDKLDFTISDSPKWSDGESIKVVFDKIGGASVFNDVRNSFNEFATAIKNNKINKDNETL
jgi:hypothetical protein